MFLKSPFKQKMFGGSDFGKFPFQMSGGMALTEEETLWLTDLQNGLFSYDGVISEYVYVIDEFGIIKIITLG